MAIFCLTKELADSLKAAAVRGEIDIAKMYEMSTQERNAMFQKYVDKDTASNVNTEFEKAMISPQKNALKKWAQATFTAGEKQTSKYRDVVDRINELDKLGVLNEKTQQNFLSDLVASKLGATVTADEAATISQKAAKLQELAKGESEFGTPTIEYYQARKDMEDYLDSLTPQSRLRVATETIGRGTMLLSVKSPLLNIESNTVMGFLQAAERRIVNRSLGGKNTDYAVKYIKFVNQVYQKSGYDITRMDSLSTGRKTLGEEKPNTQGSGKVRKVGRFYEDVVFKQLMGAPDVAFSSVHFSDSANIAAANIATSEKLSGKAMEDRALSIFKDATRIEPQTPQGTAVRAQAMADAFYATYTNKSVYADIALGIRKLFNLPSKDLRVGDNLMPFVKTPANVIGAGIDSSGILVPVDLTLRMVNTIKAIHAGDTMSDAMLDNFRGFTRQLVRAGLGMTFAYLLSSIFKPEDFIGEYPVSAKEQELLRLKKANTNSVKIGGKWVSLDYFGAIGAPLVGMLYARKYGKNLGESAYYYYRGVGRQVTKIPGFTEFSNFVQSVNENFGVTKSVGDNVKGAVNFGIDFVRARVIPGLMYDLARSSDKYERQTPPEDMLSKAKSSIPGLRQTLPIKRNVFGETVEGEGWMTILTGSRVKTADNSPLIQELVRLEDSGNLPSITDVSKTSPRAKELKDQIGDEKFTEAMIWYGNTIKTKMEQAISTNGYKQADDERKKTTLDKIKGDYFESMLSKYHYKKPKKK